VAAPVPARVRRISREAAGSRQSRGTVVRAKVLVEGFTADAELTGRCLLPQRGNLLAGEDFLAAPVGTIL
jgi:hypothetical protein